MEALLVQLRILSVLIKVISNSKSNFDKDQWLPQADKLGV